MNVPLGRDLMLLSTDLGRKAQMVERCIPTIYFLFHLHTVSLEKCFGSKEKQHYKHTASEMQNHNE